MSVEATLRAVAATLHGAGAVGTGTVHSGMRAAGALVEAIAGLLTERTDDEVRVLLRQLAAMPPRRIHTGDSDARVDAAIAARFPRSEIPPPAAEDMADAMAIATQAITHEHGHQIAAEIAAATEIATNRAGPGVVLAALRKIVEQAG